MGARLPGGQNRSQPLRTPLHQSRRKKCCKIFEHLLRVVGIHPVEAVNASCLAVGQRGSMFDIDPDPYDDAIADLFEQYAANLGTVHQHIIGPFQAGNAVAGDPQLLIKQIVDRECGDKGQSVRWPVERAQPHHRAAVKIAERADPIPPASSAPTALLVGTKPMSFRNLYPRTKSRGDVGISRSGSGSLLDEKGQNSTAAACVVAAAKGLINK